MSTAQTSSEPIRSRWTFATVVLWGLIAVAAACTVTHYGVTWDERDQKEYAEEVIQWHTSFYGNDTVLENYNRVYGAFFEVAAQLFASLGVLEVYLARHLMILLFGLIGLAYSARLGAHLFGPRAGFLTLAILAATPVYYGHMFNNPKDIPFAAMMVVALYYLIRSFEELRTPSWRVLGPLALSVGCTMGIRVGGGILLMYMAFFWALQSRNQGIAVRSLIKPVVTVFIVAWATMVLFWPWALINPILHPLQALSHFSSHHLGEPSLFNGQLIDATNPPASYLPYWFGVKLPEVYLIGWAAGVLAWVRRPRRLKLSTELLLTAWLFPLFMASIAVTAMYDGVRHYLFTVPPMAILAAAGLHLWWDSCGRRWIRWTVGVGFVGFLGWTVVDMVSLHPYQTVYFNRTAGGGLAGAADQYETDYWGASTKEAAEWLLANGLPNHNGPVRVAHTSQPFLHEHVLHATEAGRQQFVTVALDERPDVVFTTTRARIDRTVAGTRLHVVSRQGVPLCTVVDVRRRDPRPAGSPHGAPLGSGTGPVLGVQPPVGGAL